MYKVALSVDTTDAELDAITSAVPLDMLQLHGGESPEGWRGPRTLRPAVMKAVQVADAADFGRA